ncbi:hypothetical protein WICPIJ_006223 [Wickerhamomyces pijperi]|uniref:Ion transport domain-containing protein n=1 Tax=Wickerhamomyces pijperi TaxID=599730 RepID=A0A9P8Q4L5_WICPI|nr:hypothetical protein WICPIJ_006223 [Wickerhamomyces pijperi]
MSTSTPARPADIESSLFPSSSSHDQPITDFFSDNDEDHIFFKDSNPNSIPSPRQVLRICLNLKYLIDQLIPIAYDSSAVLAADSEILTPKVLRLVYEAAGGEGYGAPGTSSRKYRSCLVFALLKVSGWFEELSVTEIHDCDLYLLRSETAQYLAAVIIEKEKNIRYLFHMLTHKFVVNLNLVNSEPSNVLELAVDMHSTRVIGSEGFQRCVKWLWKGWIVQSDVNPACFVVYKDSGVNSFRTHFDPGRLKTPLYQNILEVVFSLVYLGLYTLIVNQSEKHLQPLSVTEAGFFLFTVSFILDELIKVYHVGVASVLQSFWNMFNDFMYLMIAGAMCLRFVALNSMVPDFAESTDRSSYRLLALVAPFMWIRLLLFLDVERFVGVMIIIVKEMMRESIIFFFLLITVIIGFLQGFLSLDSSDGERTSTYLIVTELLKGVLGGGDLNSFNHFVYPYSSILYYSYTFLIQVILINILVALFSSAYSKIYSNSIDEYMALFTQKVLRYSRAPDAQVYVPPLNIIEIFISPLSFILSESQFRQLNDHIMLVIYSPFLLYVAISETRTARKISYNRLRQLADDANEYNREWDLTDGYVDGEGHDGNMNHVSRDLREQREAEAEDPWFSVGKFWIAEVNNISKINTNEALTSVEEVKNQARLDKLESKIDRLTKLIEKMAEDKSD